MTMMKYPIGAGRFERLCYSVSPRFHTWVYNVRCGIAGEWWRH